MRLRILAIFCVLQLSALASVPAEVREAVTLFRPEGPAGWSFTQTTSAEGKTVVEHYDASQPVYRRWALISQDGKPPSDGEAEAYREKFTRQSHGGSAPRLNQQIDVSTLETLSEQGDESVFTARFKPAEDGDRTSAFLRVRFTWRVAARIISSFTIESTNPFSPSLGVKIAEMKTTMIYSEPTNGRPALLQSVTTRLRGQAFWFKSLDADMTVTYSDHQPLAGKRTLAQEPKKTAN